MQFTFELRLCMYMYLPFYKICVFFLRLNSSTNYKNLAMNPNLKTELKNSSSAVLCAT